ncbi:hypothetical protein [Kribbella catacumbae]|uniref:hypothetical protein n=1 Tax=Kribbella catacumbae TaxID=460086 RepID=UPI0003822CE8|nr:hypothetical protein [Kribbella catacumbae]
MASIQPSGEQADVVTSAKQVAAPEWVTISVSNVPVGDHDDDSDHGLLLVCVSFVIATVLTTVAVLRVRFVRIPRSATEPRPVLAAPLPSHLPGLDPGLLSVSRI